MTSSQFRRCALGLPCVAESAHMGHPDFRVEGKIFATLYRRGGDDFGTLKLKLAQQREVMAKAPGVFAPTSGAWGRQGYTMVRLRDVDRRTLLLLRDALFASWMNAAPASILRHEGMDYEDSSSTASATTGASSLRRTRKRKNIQKAQRTTRKTRKPG